RRPRPPPASLPSNSARSASAVGARAPSGAAVRGSAPVESRQRYTCGNPVGSVTNNRSPPGVHVGSVITPADSRNTVPASGASAGQRSSAQCPFAFRVPATQCPSGEGTTSPHVTLPPAGPGGTGSAGRLPAGRSAITDKRPPTARGGTSLAPRVPGRN